jgi:hypothetical protein
VKVDAVAVRPPWTGQAVKHSIGHHSGHRPVLLAGGCPVGHLLDQAVRVHTTLGRLLPPASIQGVRCFMLLGLAGGRLDRLLDQPRRPRSTVRDQPVQLGVMSATTVPLPSRLR